MTNTRPQTVSLWPHRLSVLLVCAVFPLVWVGGLVTTYKAGMSVYDWPTTFGYQPLGYPLGAWIFGPFDIFVEHGHRLLGIVAGLITIALVVVVWRSPSWRSLRGLAVTALVAICLQGVLGGLRVRLDRRQLALIHGCAGPAFLAFTAVLATITSPAWRAAPSLAHVHQGAGGLHAATALMALLAYVQLVLGAQVRHIPIASTPETFRFAVLGHVIHAGVLAVYATLISARIWIVHFSAKRLRFWSLALVVLVFGQIALGVLAWIAKYEWPFWESAFAQPIVQNSMGQALRVTAHVAIGSLILVVATLLAIWSRRLVLVGPTSEQANTLLPGAAA